MGQVPFGTTNLPIGLPTDLLDRLGLNKRHTRYKRSPSTDKTDGFSLSNFTETISQTGVARPYLFFVQINTPKSTGKTEQLVSLLCESTSMPGYQVMSAPQMFKGYQYEVPYGINYNDVNMTFLMDGSMKIKEFFETWFSYIFDKGFNLEYENNYRTDITITQIDAETNTIYSVTLFDAFPKVVGDINLSHTAAGDLVRMPVTFTYKRLKKEIASQDALNSIRKKLSTKGGSNLLSGIGSYFGDWNVSGLVTSAKDIWGNVSNTTDAISNTVKYVTNFAGEE